ncbi:MAG: hypothetical protein R2828_09675 [Saprospiraceae bacterium]
MARRSESLFNLSFLDLLTSALGAVIFLFIITPKGGESPAKVQQALVYFDTTQMKIHGDLPDSLLYKTSGDTLLMVLLEYKDLPKVEKTPKRIFASNEEKQVPIPAAQPVNTTPVKKEEERKPEKVEEPKKAEPTPTTPAPTPVTKPIPPAPVYKGDAPSVPCKVSFEITWEDAADNIDLFVCKDNSCVYGGRKRDRAVGQWDSGKSRNRLFGNDLRTNQEAVRQFDEIIPGEYKLYAQLKESGSNKKTVPIEGLIYTKGKSNLTRGESFSKSLTVTKDKVLIGTIILQADGNYQFKTMP